MELDLRTGAAFTRLQTLTLQRMGGPLAELVISYGSCQFPTLGFVVDRYLKVRNFLPEPFWKLEIKHTRDDIPCTFAWDRTRLFDRAAVTMIYERCLKSKYVTVDRVVQKSTKKWKPLPLTTVELQKNASKYLRMNSQTAMKVAEDLYNKGFISYPRTETDIFSRDMNLKTLCGKHTADNRWGDFATNLVEGGAFQWPRAGRNDDKAHPPIHPITAYNGDRSTDEGRLYEFVVRRFLACCSSDAVGTSTSVAISFPTLPVPESFHASGLQILARNYLDVYPYDQWTGSLIPAFEQGERFEPQSCMVNEGETSSPGYLTEPDLIALMDANGIGTDATMAEHIAKIKVRGYVMTQPRSGGGGPAAAASASATRGRGGARGRGSRGGRRGGRGGSNATAAGGPTTGVEEFIPTTLGVALIEGYENVGFEEKLSKPFLRKDLEVALKKIVSGEMTREEVVRREVGLYKRVYYQTEESIESLRRAARRYVFGLEGGGQA